MTSLEQNIFSKAYQSYLTGGDTYVLRYPNLNPDTIENYISALTALAEKELIEIISKSEKKVRIVLTDKGIDYCLNSLSM